MCHGPAWLSVYFLEGVDPTGLWHWSRVEALALDG